MDELFNTETDDGSDREVATLCRRLRLRTSLKIRFAWLLLVSKQVFGSGTPATLETQVLRTKSCRPKRFGWLVAGSFVLCLPAAMLEYASFKACRTQAPQDLSKSQGSERVDPSSCCVRCLVGLAFLLMGGRAGRRLG